MNDRDRGIRFSVIIPAYNAERTIADTLRSCLEQTYPPHEVIVVSDGSTDGTEAVVQGFGSSVICLRTGGNTGPAHARNIGLAAATGTHIAFLDADDTWHREKLRVMAKLLAAQPDARFIFHLYTMDAVDFPIDRHALVLQPFPFRKLLWRNPIATPCVVMARGNDFRFDESMRYMEDYDLWLQTAAHNTIYRLPLPLTRLGRPVLSAGGQSSDRRAMRRGERVAYRHLARRQPQYLLLLPLLIGFSWVKHAVKYIAT